MARRVASSAQFGAAYSQAVAGTDAGALVALLDTTPDDAFRREIAGHDVAALASQLQFHKVPAAHKKRFASLAEAYLAYVAGPAAPYDTWSVVFTRATAIFALDVPWFSPALKFIGKTLVDLAAQSDAQHNHGKTVDAAGRLSKCAALSANDRTAATMAETKRSSALALANLSFRAYLRLRNTRLCETVLGSVNNALQMNIRFDGQGDGYTGEEGYPMSERVMFHYYIGRIRLAYGRITVAAENLRWAFDRCPPSSRHNRRVIAIPLVSAYLILGRYPTQKLLTECGLVDQFSALTHHLRLGNGAGVMSELQRHMHWLRIHGLYGHLQEKLILGVWRNIFRRCLALQLTTATNAPPTLRLSTIRVAGSHDHG
ncbi:hypothetical protein MCUN1_003775 [Malassezia cuniculi]|uniref:COP9 signalosome complex subunit 12 n=1 Tax=Malassezia cuniculi TaxID=948313 RepID=A0AAF0J8I4_9BASI|nr:hypothetical protein MCUN1_003775 [Malassezia cuniculi]